MDIFNENYAIHGKSFQLWMDGDLMAEVLTAKAKSDLTTETVYIAGQLGNGDIITGANGTGSLTFNTVIGDLPKKVNDCIKSNKPFIFDLIGEFENKTYGTTRRVIIEECKITSFSPLDVDIQKLLQDAYDFKYNPQNVDIE
ncbi:phage tail tube protein [Clostridium beijerinckii]|uniref:phage tail tube protein n=1 Tax=Clostridium beijerinckii TaxID=1520 RepID=UPI00098C9F8E|nr:phage tail tube protein [Clostridium beijerinckii]MBA8935526.1 hypothetical protein [Clostridium beijerinckii]NRU39921.1 hypothetical protein [Clostridium beijerinckii]NSA96800.1 hypothetical protein [Clostridium beijerinckii]OOM52298.1 phage-like element PBSX protein XkdM [Clostridium beijerinckii]OOM65500.1 phage-like element PBSX protein XkdM [Clostridium beijerinckii]